MKSKLYVFLIMFSIWCLINIFLSGILRNFIADNYFSSFHWINFLVAFIFSVLAAISARLFYLVVFTISIYAAASLIPGLIQGDLIGDNGFIPVEKINNMLFVHNEFLLTLNMYLFYERMPINAAICLSDIIIIGLSAFLIVLLRNLAIQQAQKWLDNEQGNYWI